MEAATAVAPQPAKRTRSLLHRLTCAAQNYAWGRHHEDSEVRGGRSGPNSSREPDAWLPRTRWRRGGGTR